MTYTYRGGTKLSLRKDPGAFRLLGPEDDPVIARLHHVDELSLVGSVVNSDNLEADMAQVRASHVAHHLYWEEESGEPWPMTDQILVTFHSPPEPEDLDSLLANFALVVVKVLTDKVYLLQLTDDTGVNPVKLVVQLTENKPSTVAYVEHNLQHRMAKSSSPPTDPLYPVQWHLHEEVSHPNTDPRSSSRTAQAWELLGNGGDPEVTICVADDGCRLDHSDFDGLGKFRDWAYFDGMIHSPSSRRLVNSATPMSNPRRMYQSGHDHGTACCGVAAAESDAALTIGAAPDCRLLPIKFLSDHQGLYFTDDELVEVIEFVSDKADVMSNSWGSSPTRNFAQQVLDEIEGLRTKGGRRGRGIVFLWAAGNSNCPISHSSNVDIPYTHGWQVRTSGLKWIGPKTSKVFTNNLADHPGVLHVAALASTARRSHYSNYGTGIDLCAPSSNSHAYYRMSVKGLDVVTIEGTGSRTVTASFGGTSSATPLTAGIAALVISANPALTADEVRSILLMTASKDLDLASYPRTPPAKYDMNPTWDVSPVIPFDSGEFKDDWSPWFGYGKVDAEAAVQRALDGLRDVSVGMVVAKGVQAAELLYDDGLGANARILSSNDPLLPIAANSAELIIGLVREDGTPASGVIVTASVRPLTLSSASWRTRGGLTARWPHRAAEKLRNRIDQGFVRLQGVLESLTATTDGNGNATFTIKAWHICGNEAVPATDRVTFSWNGGSSSFDIACGVAGLQLLPSDRSAGVVTKSGIRGKYAGKPIVNNLLQVGEAWKKARKPKGIVDYITITDGSLRWGGLIPPHLTHRFGGTVDIRPISTDGNPTSIGQKNYSRIYTEGLTDLLHQSGATEVRFGEQLRGVTRVSGDHKDHIHVSWLIQPSPSEPWAIPKPLQLAVDIVKSEE